MKIEPRQPAVTTFSMASMTDIVILLLIFFLLSSTYIIQPGIKVNLPPSETSQVIDEKGIIVTIARDGTIWVGDERSGIEGMAAMLRRHIVHGASQTVIIKADKQVSLELAVNVIDRIKAAGGERFLIATMREEE
jgi:biopolymer transport protein ExbD